MTMRTDSILILMKKYFLHIYFHFPFFLKYRQFLTNAMQRPNGRREKYGYVTFTFYFMRCVPSVRRTDEKNLVFENECNKKPARKLKKIFFSSSTYIQVIFHRNLRESLCSTRWILGNRDVLVTFEIIFYIKSRITLFTRWVYVCSYLLNKKSFLSSQDQHNIHSAHMIVCFFLLDPFPTDMWLPFYPVGTWFFDRYLMGKGGMHIDGGEHQHTLFCFKTVYTQLHNKKRNSPTKYLAWAKIHMS